MPPQRLVAILYRLWRLVRRPPHWLRLTLLVAAIFVSYWFIITAGTWTHFATWNATYNLMAEGFRNGHLYIPIAPHPELLRAKDPFDPVYYNYWLWDASLSRGHIYFYWGPLPALILAEIKSALSWNFEIGDQYFVFVFYTMHLVAGALLIIRMARRAFPELPFALLVFSIIVFGYAHPSTFIVATPGIYQAAIIGGQAFLLVGLVFVTDAVWNATSRPPSRRLLVMAGFCWGLGIATRVSIVLPVAVLILLAGLLVARPGSLRSVWLQRISTMLWLGTPVAAFVVALLVYNRARFDGFLDFGMHKQMSTMQFRTEWAYLVPDLYSYLLRPMVQSCEFPFVTAPFHLGALAFPKGFHIPPGYSVEEPVAGMLLAAPWTFFLFVAAVFMGRAGWRALRTRPPLVALGARQRINVWFAVSFVTIGLVTGLPIFFQFIATMRYLVDVASGMVLLSTWGAWSLYQSVRDRPWLRRLTTAVIVGVGGLTIGLGLLLGVTGYNDMFKWHNPPLYERMVRTFSVCSHTPR